MANNQIIYTTNSRICVLLYLQLINPNGIYMMAQLHAINNTHWGEVSSVLNNQTLYALVQLQYMDLAENVKVPDRTEIW